MARVSTAGAGFLLAVLWFDLMFDVQVLSEGSGQLSEATLHSMATYYRRVTTDSWPMGALLPFAMLTTITSTVWQWRRGELARAWAVAALALCVPPILLALTRVLPNAIQLATRSDSLDVQSQLARTICYDHLFCFVAISLFLVLQVLHPLLDRGSSFESTESSSRVRPWRP